MKKTDLTKIPDEFKELLRAKLKKQDEATYKEALNLYERNLLGYYFVMTAPLGSIDLDEIKEVRKKARKEAEQRKKESWTKYEKEREYESGLTWLYEDAAARVGYYAGIDSAGIIRYLCYESGNHREGGAIYTNTPFGQFGDFNTNMAEIKAKAPALYNKLKEYRQQ